MNIQNVGFCRDPCSEIVSQMNEQQSENKEQIEQNSDPLSEIVNNILGEPEPQQESTLFEEIRLFSSATENVVDDLSEFSPSIQENINIELYSAVPSPADTMSSLL